MTTIQDILNAYAPGTSNAFPIRPSRTKKTMTAIRHCQSGHYGHSLYRCQSCGEQHRVNHSCGNRHCPQCQHHKTQVLATPPSGQATSRAALPPHLHRPGDASTLYPLASSTPITPCSRLLPPSNASPKTSALSAPISRVSPVSSIPGAGNSSTPPHPLYRPGRRPLQGPHPVATLQRQLLCPR